VAMTLAKNLLKVAGTATLVAIIGLVIVGDEQAEVPEATADLYWLNAGEDSKHTKFVTALEDYGFEPPQAYTWNGINMFVSRKSTEMSPQEVLYDMQAHFMKAGVNGDVFSRPANPDAFENPAESKVETFLAGHTAAEFAAGSMIPVADSADYVAMVGVDTKENAENLKEFAEEALAAESSDDIFNSTRYVEAFRNGSDRHTTILAIWSDRNLKVSQLTPGGGEHRSIPDMPVCMGCTVSSQVIGRNENDGFVSMTMESRDTPEGSLSYYSRVLPQRGWQPDKSADLTHSVMKKAGKLPEDQSQTMTYVKKGRMLTVQASWADSLQGSRVSMFSSPQ
jgi:hypothetical protein